MNKQEIEQALRRASEELPRVDYNAAAHTEVPRMEVHDYITRQTPALRRPRRWVPMAAAACLVLLLAGGGWYYWAFQMVYSTLYLDVNPSFVITLNREDKVLDVEGRNDDAETLLEGRSYRNWSLEAALGALSDDMAKNGYLSSSEDVVDVSVESRSGDRAKVLRIETEEFFAQRLEELDEPAPAPEVTPMPDPTPSPAPEVTPMPEPTPSPVPTQKGHHEEKNKGSCITSQAVADVILAKAPDAKIHEIKLDEDDGVWTYEIECYVGEDKYDAEVDAVTGELLRWEWDD